MEQRLTIVTIGVDDLAAMRDFYVEKFGWTPVAENKDIVFFKLSGTLLGFFEKEDWPGTRGWIPPPSALSPSPSRTT